MKKDFWHINHSSLSVDLFIKDVNGRGGHFLKIGGSAAQQSAKVLLSHETQRN